MRSIIRWRVQCSLLLALVIPDSALAAPATSQTEVIYDVGKADFKATLRGASSVAFCLYEQETGGVSVFCDTKLPTEYLVERLKADKEGAAKTLYGSTSFFRLRTTLGSVSNLLADLTKRGKMDRTSITISAAESLEPPSS